MFSEEQIKFMNSIGITYDFNNLSGDDYFEIENRVADHLQLEGIDSNDEVNSVGLMCESILDAID